jgi:hypothetical protein
MQVTQFSLLQTIFTLIIWLVIMQIIRVSEIYFFFSDQLSHTHLPLFLLVLCTFILQLNFSLQTKRLRKVRLKFFKSKLNNMTEVVLSAILLILFVGFQFGSQQLIDLMSNQTRIQSISKNWSIQGDRVAIEGRNFGKNWQPGKVFVGLVEFKIILWSDTRIVIEQPVARVAIPYTAVLTVKTASGDIIHDVMFTIKDPSDVL